MKPRARKAMRNFMVRKMVVDIVRGGREGVESVSLNEEVGKRGSGLVVLWMTENGCFEEMCKVMVNQDPYIYFF